MLGKLFHLDDIGNPVHPRDLANAFKKAANGTGSDFLRRAIGEKGVVPWSLETLIRFLKHDLHNQRRNASGATYDIVIAKGRVNWKQLILIRIIIGGFLWPLLLALTSTSPCFSFLLLPMTGFSATFSTS